MRFATFLTVVILMTGTAPVLAAAGSSNIGSQTASTNMTSSVELTYDSPVHTPTGEGVRVDSLTMAPEALDFAIFGLIGLGIVGLLWVRRHTSEL